MIRNVGVRARFFVLEYVFTLQSGAGGEAARLAITAGKRIEFGKLKKLKQHGTAST